MTERGQEMPEKSEPMNNSDRLLKYLKDGSLAYNLVQAHRNRETASPMESVNAVIQKRLEQVRKSIDNPKT